MRRSLFALMLMLLVATGPATAQSVSPAEGNWGCIALIDNTKAGILTIFAGSYGYASANFGSSASGTGNAQLATDGVTFLDGTLPAIGINYGLTGFDANGLDTLTLYNPEKPVLVCTPR